MINAIIFDLGDVFLNKDKQAKDAALAVLGIQWDASLEMLESGLETGDISPDKFLKTLQERSNNATINQVKDAWNTGIADFPLKRLEFLQKLSDSYRLFLLSNTDQIHIEKFEQDAGPSFYTDFYRCFEKVYFSHETGVRKPDAAAFNFVVSNHDIQPKNTLVVDDKKFNTDAAELLGFKAWHLKKGEEDVTELFERRILSLEKAP